MLILCGAVAAEAALGLRETSLRVRRRRQESRSEAPGFVALARKYFALAVVMLIREPLLIIISAYLTLTYGTSFSSFQLFPCAFVQCRWSRASAYLPLLSVALGVLSARLRFSVVTLSWYKRRMAGSGGATPEDRLPSMILGAISLPPSLIWFGWSNDA